MEVEAARTSGRGCCRHCCWGLARQPLSKELPGQRQAKELAGAVLTMGLRTYYGPTYLLWAYYGPTYLLWAYYRPYLLWACVLTRRYFVWLHLVWLHLVWLHLVWLPEELVGAKLDPLEG